MQVCLSEVQETAPLLLRLVVLHLYLLGGHVTVTKAPPGVQAWEVRFQSTV